MNKEKLLELINEYGELQYKCGDRRHLNVSKSIEYFNESEEVFNKILEILDNK